jgi:hypothetical protein
MSREKSTPIVFLNFCKVFEGLKCPESKAREEKNLADEWPIGAGQNAMQPKIVTRSYAMQA